MQFLEEVKNYSVQLFAGGAASSGFEYRAIIGLRNDNHELIAACYFHRDDKSLPAADKRNEQTSFVELHYPGKNYDEVLDLLRNEKPIYVRYEAGDGKNIAHLATNTDEPVGEGE